MKLLVFLRMKYELPPLLKKHPTLIREKIAVNSLAARLNSQLSYLHGILKLSFFRVQKNRKPGFRFFYLVRIAAYHCRTENLNS